jgi:hypothetical protein
VVFGGGGSRFQRVVLRTLYWDELRMPVDDGVVGVAAVQQDSARRTRMMGLGESSCLR